LEPLREFKDVMLLGIAGTGKTFLLRKLIYHPETHATPNPPLPEFRNLLFCFVNCMAIDDLSCSSFFKLLIAATKPAFYDWPALIEHNYDLVSQPNCSIIEITNAMLETVKTVQRHHRKCLVFMLDQFDDVYDQLPSEIFLILKDVKLSSSEPQPIYILAMRNELEEDINIHQFLRAMPARCDCWIRPFQVDELEDVASPYMLGPEKLKLSIELGGKQPRLTDLVAASLSKTSKMTGDEREFVEHLLADRQIASHCREMWNSLLPDEQEALRSIANGAPRIQQAIQDRLIREKWVLVKDQDLTFISPLFGAFVKSLLQDAHPLAKSKTETGLLFDENTLEFIIDGKRMSYEDLTKLERDLLLYLYQEAGKVCSFADISNRVWGYGDSEYAASTDSIARLIHGLRKKLDQKSPGAGNRHIINVRGTGYRCVIK